jgi:multidrug efflux system outer membrane protein
MRWKAHATLALAALALSACTVGPDYKQPETPLPAAFGPGVDGPLLVQPDWWTLYGDAELTRVVELAFKQSPTVEKALAKVEEADAYVRQVGGNALPSVDAAGSADRARHSTQAGPPAAKGGGTYNTLKGGLSTSFELDFYGKLRRAREGAEAEAFASREAGDAVRIMLAGQVAQAYFAIRSLEAQGAATAQLLGDARASQALAGKRAQGGAASSLDVAQARGSVAALAAQEADLSRARELAGSRLALLCGAPGLALAAGPWGAPAPAPPAGLPSGLIKARPDLRAAEDHLKSANAAIGYTQAFKYPTFSITGALGAESRDLSKFLSGGARTWSLGAGVYAPIFDGGQINAQVDGAKARARQAAADYVGAVQAAFAEVQDALVETRARAGMDGLLAERQAAAQAAQAAAQSRYDGGYAPYLEVLDARSRAGEADLARLRNREAQFAASVQLFKALGGGWNAAGAAAPVPAKK